MFAQIAFALALVAFLLTERISNAAAVIWLGVLSPTSLKVSPTKRYAGMQMVGSGVSFMVSTGSGVADAVGAAASSVMSYIVWVLVLCVLLTTLYVVQEVRPDILIAVVEYWNATLAPVVHSVFLVPLSLVTMVLESVVPVWNAGWFMLSRAGTELIAHAMLNGVDPFVRLAQGIAGLVSSSVRSVSQYTSSINSCRRDDELVCYDPGRRMLDLITPLSQMRGVAVATTDLLTFMCRSMSGPIDIVLYPLRDINFAKGLHGVVNGLLYPLIQMPVVTAERCIRSNRDLVMCLPDFEPAFNMLTSGLRSMGLMMDNWLDVTSIIVQSSLGFDPGLECDSVALAITPLNRSQELFGANQTTVVGLTEGLYAITDGTSVQYFNHYDSVSSILAPSLWPIQIDPSFGVAAVTFFAGQTQRDDVGEASTTMMGCRCDDDAADGRMKIRCALALYEAAHSVDPERNIEISDNLDLVFDVVFQQRSTATQMRCEEAEISVQSVRWPVRRFTQPLEMEDKMDGTCTGRGTCTMVDAVVWVQPRCSSSSLVAQQPICREGNNRASCFP